MMKRHVPSTGVALLVLSWTTSAPAQQPAPAAEAAAEPRPEAQPPAQPAQPTPTAEEQKALEEEFRRALAGDEQQPSEAPAAESEPALASTTIGGTKLALLDLSFDLLAAAGASTAAEPELRELEAGGHDPKNHGFTIQNVELTFAGVVDPYFRGDANIVLQIDPEGESTIELEEAYLTTLDLPFNLQVKAGQFFGAFGRLNPEHPHAWDFVDDSVVNARLLGPDGFRNPGVQLSWLTPLPFFAELIGSIQNSQGETATSFLSVPDESVAGRTLIDRDVSNLGDLAYVVRLRTSFDLGDEATIVPGFSALFGPNATAENTQTQIYGADLFFKWKPLTADHGWPFVTWQSEAMLRRYTAAAVFSERIEADPRRTLHDFGLYSQLVWGFARPWSAGVRYDYARGQTDDFDAGDASYSTAADPTRDLRHRASAVVTYHPSEFSKFRLQYNFDRAQFLSDDMAHSVWLQCEILFGAHGAHKF